ncbi:hypothetical protein EJB05_14933, partial [Eragrostis curvula]
MKCPNAQAMTGATQIATRDLML